MSYTEMDCFVSGTDWPNATCLNASCVNMKDELTGSAIVLWAEGINAPLTRSNDCLVRAFRLQSYGNPVQLVIIMDTVSVNRFRDNLKTFVGQVVSNHTPLKVTRRTGDDFVVLSAEDWEREQESLYVAQNSSLMQQIAKSLSTHSQGTGTNPRKSN